MEFPNYKHQKIAVALFASFWLLGNYVIHLAYECNLRANLIHRELSKIPETLQDMIDMNQNLYLHELYGFKSFQTSVDPVKRELYRRYELEKSTVSHCEFNSSCHALSRNAVHV